MLRKFLVVLVVLIALAAAVAAGFFYAARRAEARAEARVAQDIERFSGKVAEAFDEALGTLTATTDRLGERFEGIDNLLTAQELRLRRYRNAEHLVRARSLGLGRVSGEEEIERLVAQGRLVRLQDGPYYYVQDLEVSVPYVTQDAARMLDLIGERFHERLRAEGLPLFRYCISSVLRTAENQRALRRINPNAARGVSTHEFGTTLDVVYHKYGYWPSPEDALPSTDYPFLDQRLEEVRRLAFDALGMRYWQELQGILGRVLIELQDEGKVLVTLEREQPVFHITVAQRLPER